jgi:hypothetical protein
LDVTKKTMEAIRSAESLSGRPIRVLEDAIAALLERGEFTRTGQKRITRYHVQGGSDA